MLQQTDFQKKKFKKSKIKVIHILILFNVFELITKINNFPTFHTNIFHFRKVRKREEEVHVYI